MDFSAFLLGVEAHKQFQDGVLPSQSPPDEIYSEAASCFRKYSKNFPEKCPFPVFGWHFSMIYRTFDDRERTQAILPVFRRLFVALLRLERPPFRHVPSRYSGLPAGRSESCGKHLVFGYKSGAAKKSVITRCNNKLCYLYAFVFYCRIPHSAIQFPHIFFRQQA